MSRRKPRPTRRKPKSKSPENACRVAVEQLRWNCPPIRPSGVPPTAEFLLGQERPMAALRTGLAIHAQGYNLFVSGLMGSGRTAVVEWLLRGIQPFCRRVPDRVFVHNFREPTRPLLVSLPPGKALAFKNELVELGETVHSALSSALRSRLHRMSRQLVLRGGEAGMRRILDAMQRVAHKHDCALVRFESQGGITTDIYPVVDGEPVTPDALGALVSEGKLSQPDRERMLRQRDRLLERLGEVNERIREENLRIALELRTMDRRLAWKVLQTQTRTFLHRWPQPEVAEWIDAAGEFIEGHLPRFVRDETNEAGDGEALPEASEEGRFAEFQAKVVKTSIDEACPVVVETNPTFGNLFGAISPPADGALPGPTCVHPGAILRAEGGYLVLRCLDVLREPGVWSYLKRTLQSARLEIRDYDQGSGAQTGAMQPEAIPVDLKVVLIGEPGVYEQLAAEDPQMPQIFKVHAEFDASIPVTQENLTRYADYLLWLTESEHLLPLAPDAMAAVAEYGARAARRRDRLITRYSELGDLAREAAQLATDAGSKRVRRAHIEAAIQRKHYRHDLAQEQAEREYQAGYMNMTTTGFSVGQINALTLLDTGSLEFGRPCRITCNSGVAVPLRSGLVNIEGIVNLSGPIHDKGVMILEGYLLQEFGGEGPLCVQATICFEQLYNGVEGDSASLAQLLALLSSLSDVPLRQGLAITGSVNQKGEVQAVGGVNEKIEGFFRLCRSRGLTGDQGVVLPRANLSDLMLDPTLVAAVKKQQFTIHAVGSVADAVALFTGRPAEEVLTAVRSTMRRFRDLAMPAYGG